MISNFWLWVLYLMASVIILSVIYPRFPGLLFRIVVGPPKLKIVDLYDIFHRSGPFIINRDPTKKFSDAHQSVQIRSSTLSVFLHSLKSNPLMEVVDISCPGTAGMILTIENGRLLGLKRSRGKVTIGVPSLSREERKSLSTFMEQVREKVK